MKPRNFLLKPEWIEVKAMPHMFGVGEPLTHKWCRLKMINSVIIKTEPNAKRGKRLIEVESVRKLLESQAGNSPAQAGPGCKGRKQQVAA